MRRSICILRRERWWELLHQLDDGVKLSDGLRDKIVRLSAGDKHEEDRTATALDVSWDTCISDSSLCTRSRHRNMKWPSTLRKTFASAQGDDNGQWRRVARCSIGCAFPVAQYFLNLRNRVWLLIFKQPHKKTCNASRTLFVRT